MYDTLDRNQALTPNDKLVLALLYDASGQWPKAQEQMDYLIGQYPGMHQYLAQYVQLLLRHDDPRRAEAELKKLEELEAKRAVGTNAYATEDLRALWLEKIGKKDEAVALIRKTVGRPGTRPEGAVVLIAALAQRRSMSKRSTCASKRGGRGRTTRSARRPSAPSPSRCCATCERTTIKWRASKAV